MCHNTDIDTQTCATIQKYSISAPPSPPKPLNPCFVSVHESSSSSSSSFLLARCELGCQPKPETLDISLNPEKKVEARPKPEPNPGKEASHPSLNHGRVDGNHGS